jgi:hypothetical protein
VPHADEPHPAARPIESFRHHAAYVLLGEPGSGKTRLFEEEAASLGTAARFTTVRDFLRAPADVADRSRILYIDAMDEQRAAEGKSQPPLDGLIERLTELGRPRFRLSCRAADWHRLDTKDLASMSADGAIMELQLQPFIEPEIVRFLEHNTAHRPSEPAVFIVRARAHGLESMLGNPMLLDLLAQAVAGDAWPASRGEIFERACRRLAEERNETHERHVGAGDTEELLNDAGLLCAVLLLADASTYRLTGYDNASVRVSDLPARLGISLERIQRALYTKMFVGNAQERRYRHRSIAEFLAARAIAKRFDEGLPVSRILAQMSGAAGGILDSLRGLFGWIVSLSDSYRDVLMHHDVLALVYYGDVHAFGRAEKRSVFEAIYETAGTSALLGRRDWRSTAFGALGTSDMQSYLEDVLARDRFEEPDQVLLLSVLEAIEHGQPMPALLGTVAAVACDSRHSAPVRETAIDALVAQSDPHSPYLLALLVAIRDGTVEDEDDELAGRLLLRLYPGAIATRTLVADYLVPPRKNNFFGSYREFWELELLNLVPSSDAAVLVDAIGERLTRSEETPGDTFLGGLYGQAILHAVQQLGSSLQAEQLYRWISMGLTQYGYRMRHEVRSRALGQWLVEHPEQLQAVYEHGLLQLHAQGKHAHFDSWLQTLLNQAEIPASWYNWLLELAARHDDETIVRFCFATAARAAAHVPERFANGLQQVADWVDQHRGRWPACETWHEESTTVPLEDWRREELAVERARMQQIAAEQAYRRDLLAPDLALTLAGGSAPQFMSDVLRVMTQGGYGIQGDTAQARVESYLGCDAITAQQVIDALATALDRAPLPPWSTVVEQAGTGEESLVQRVSLYAADQRWGTSERAAGIGTYKDAPTLLAFSLIRGEKRVWFDALTRSHPDQVSAVMQAFLANALARRDWRLRAVRWLDACPPGSPVPGDVVQVLLPQLMPPFADDFPAGPMGAVLHAAIRYASKSALEQWVETVLSTPGVTARERAVALTASLAHSDRFFDALLAVLADAPDSAAACCRVALRPSPRTILDRLPIPFLGRLVEALGCLVGPRREAIFAINHEDGIRMGVTAMLAELVARTASSATLELARLQSLPALIPWRYQLSESLQRSASRVREAASDELDPLAVATVLNNCEPANERDLIAFVLAHADTVMRRIRYGNTNMLRSFWRRNGKGQRVPLIENDCRDRFLHDLRREVAPMGIHIGKEEMRAGDKRADMAIMLTRGGRHINVPVEVKLDNHPAVWHAWDTQLMRSYVPDPDAGEYGVYLVLFAGYRTRCAPSGERPRNAEAMAQAFDAVIPTEYHGRLHGMVLDISWA